jgi:predicted phage tail protein
MKRLTLCLVALALTSVVTLDAIPAAPANLTASVIGSTVTLSWTAPPGGPLGYRVEAGSAPGLGNVANTLIGMATSFSAAAVPSGTYYVRVRAVASDGESEPSNEVVVVVGSGGSCTTAPQSPTSFIATLNGTTVNLAWAFGGGCAATNYMVQAGSASGLADIAVVNAGTALSFSATAPPGAYYLRVVAQNAFGSSGPSNEASVVVGGTTTPLGPLMGIVDADSTRIISVTMPATGRYQATKKSRRAPN